MQVTKNNITNTHKPGTVDIRGTKTWNDNGNADIRPETITINLYANGKLGVASRPYQRRTIGNGNLQISRNTKRKGN